MRTPYLHRSLKEEEQPKLKEFLTEFEHSPTLDYPVMILERGGEWKAAMQVITHPLIVFAWNPKRASHRDTVEGVQYIRDYGREKMGGLITALSINSPFKPHMDRLGFVDCKANLYALK